MKKRGLLKNKKATVVEPLYFIIIQIVLSLAIFGALMAYVLTAGDDILLEKKILARDQALLINAIYSAPGDVMYEYYNSERSITGFYFEYQDQKVTVTEKPGELIGKKTRPILEQYPFAEDSNYNNVLDKIIKDKEKINFIKEGRVFKIFSG